MTTWRVALAAACALVGPVGLTACGGDDAEPRPLPAVEAIDDAVAALEESLGGPQRYFEINADPVLVNLFVASPDGDAAVPYVFVDGRLEEPGPEREVSEGATFTYDEVDIDADRVLGRVSEELPESTLATFVIVVGPDRQVRYEVIVRSAQGGRLAVQVSGTGEVMAVETL